MVITMGNYSQNNWRNTMKEIAYQHNSMHCRRGKYVAKNNHHHNKAQAFRNKKNDMWEIMKMKDRLKTNDFRMLPLPRPE
jgi:hypothetical protein